jgi:hypothetical protein
MEKLTMEQLKQIAKDKGIVVGSKVKKADLIELLNGVKPKTKVSDKPFKGEY